MATTVPNLSDSTAPRGVNGWLVVLVIGLAVLGPSRRFMDLQTQIFSIEGSRVNLALSPVWQHLKLVMWSSWTFQAAIGIVAAGLLVYRWKRSTPHIVMWLLFAMCVLPPIISWMGFYMVNPQSAARVSQETVVSLLQGFIFAVVWSLYLYRSKRVRNTYTV